MKAIRYTLAAALTVIAAASCQDNIAPEQESGIIINATIENTGTKTVLGEGFIGSDKKVHHKVLWSTNESITLFDGANNNHGFTTYGAESAESASFTHNAVKGNTALAGFIETETGYYYALYPSHTESTFDAETSTINYGGSVSNLQTPILKGFKDDFAIALGTGNAVAGDRTDKANTSIEMLFKNVTALIKFEITTNDITEVRFIDQNGQYLAGSGFSFTNSETEIITSGGTEEYVFLNQSKKIAEKQYEYTPLEPGVYYMVVVPPSSVIKPRIDLHTQTTHTSSKINSSYIKSVKGKTEILLKPGMILDLGKFSSSRRVTE